MPAWLGWLEEVHASHLRPSTIGFDAGVWLVAAAVAGGSPQLLALLTATWLIAGLASGLYEKRSSVETQGIAWYLKLLRFPVLLVGAMLWVGPLGAQDLPRVALVLGATAALVTTRTIAWVALAASRRRGLGLRRTLVAGAVSEVERVGMRLLARPELGLTPVARVAASVAPEDHEIKLAIQLIESGEVEHVLFVRGGDESTLADELIHRTEAHVGYSLVMPLGAMIRSSLPCRLGEYGVLPLGYLDFSPRPLIGKRIFDVVVSALVLTMALPVLAVAALLVFLGDRGGPVFYGQPRVGRDGRLFRMWKFRSMVVGADLLLEEHRERNVNSGLLFKLQDDPRITTVGRILRRLSIDELPQLFNVLRGDMSIVGPRPLPVDPAAFDDVARKRHAVRPGITGPWQVAGGNVLSYESMVELDLAYVATRTFRSDLDLLIRTVPAVLFPRAPY
jgi:lipopolysaccharide/colanic/teichoic acid biosynthesis glycosyltransferase